MSPNPDFVLSIIIPIPTHIPRARGVHATGTFGAETRVRLHNDELVLIQQQADALGVTVANFIRHCTVETAKALDNDIRYDQHTVGRLPSPANASDEG